MPYIPEERRAEVIAIFAGEFPQTPGELNFTISDIINDYLTVRGVSYATLNEVIGVLECAKLELYRRVVADYETEALERNGDVYTVNQEGGE